jgi:hypothetical protein
MSDDQLDPHISTDDYDKKEKPIPTKRTTRKKPKDKPKRPLSAYNFFFKEEREKILKVLNDEEAENSQDEKSEDYLTPEQIVSLKKEGGKVSFEEMGKIIGRRWKNINPDKLSKFQELANDDTERYKQEMQAYNGRQEAKMRSEAMKPSYRPAGADMMMMGGKGATPGGANMAGYDSMSFPGGYPYGMDYSAYAAMYGPYGGYPGMGGADGSGGGDPNAQYGSGGMPYGMMPGSYMGYG